MELLDCRSRGWREMVEDGEAIEMTWPNKTTCRRKREGGRERERCFDRVEGSGSGCAPVVTMAKPFPPKNE
jgi:hypothetical protein